MFKSLQLVRVGVTTELYSVCTEIKKTPGPGFEPGNRLRETRLATLRRNRWAIRAQIRTEIKGFKVNYLKKTEANIFHIKNLIYKHKLKKQLII